MMKNLSLDCVNALRQGVEPFLALDVLAKAHRRAAEGKPVYHLEVGEPSCKAPLAVREAAKKALDEGRICYTPALGLMALRARIAQHYKDDYGINVAPERIAITTGSSAGFILSFLAAFKAGDRVGLPCPSYPAYRNTLKALGLIPVDIPVSAEDRYALTPDGLKAAHKKTPLAGLLVASPANPSGTMMQPASFQALIEACDALGIRFLSDEIYHGLVYQGRTESALVYSDNAVIINSFSKYYCMTGWRIGWMVLPENLVRPVERLAQSLYISAPYLSQIAAEQAFAGRSELEAIKAGYARNRIKLLSELPKIGFEGLYPVDGAFYIYTDARRFTNDALAFCKTLLDETGVAITPGVDFDPVHGHTMVRFSFAGAQETIDKALEIMACKLS